MAKVLVISKPPEEVASKGYLQIDLGEFAAVVIVRPGYELPFRVVVVPTKEEQTCPSASS